VRGPKPRAHILAIDPYVGGRSTIEGKARVIKLSSNESALGPSPKALAAYANFADRLARYPDGSAQELREAIAAYHGLDPERIVCGNGSDELIDLLARAYAGEGDEVLFSEHSFLIFSIVARGVGATPVAAPERGLRIDVGALLGRVTSKTRIVFLANPNNPTGSYVAREELERLRRELPSEVLLVIDGAYAEFVTKADYTQGFELVDAGENVAVVHTFSKIYGLAALRLGWGYAPASVVDVLNRLRAPFNVSGPTQAAGIAAVRDGGHVEAARAHNERWRDWLAAELSALGLRVHPSVCNFVLVEFPDRPGRDAAAANQHLLSRGIIVRAVETYGLPRCLRISIGLEDEVRAVAEALKEFRG